MCSFILFVTIATIFGTISADPVSQAVADFAKASLVEWAAKEPVIHSEEIGYVNFRDSILSLSGSLSNVELHGVNRNTSISTKIERIESPGYGGLEYNITIHNPILKGDYDFTGSFASAIPLNRTGRWQMTLEYPIDFYCYVILYAKDGYVKQERCFIHGFDFYYMDSTFDFTGLIPEPNPLSPAAVQEIYKNIGIEASVYGGLQSMSQEAMESQTMEHLQSSFDGTKLLDMLHFNKQGYEGKFGFKKESNPVPSANARNHDLSSQRSMGNRISEFFVETLRTLAKDFIDAPFNRTFDYERSVLMPINGTLTNLRLTGFSNFSEISVIARAGSFGVDISVMIKVPNFAMTGQYDVSGSIAGDTENTPVNSKGFWSVSPAGPCTLDFSGDWETRNGFLVFDRNPFHGFTCGDNPDFSAEFTGLFDNLELTPEVSQLGLRLMGRGALEYLNSLNDVLEGIVISHLQDRLNTVPVIDILLPPARA